ncbi:MAG: Gfo/Idh/MocA family oxidoreductase [Planctomycetaceae bacterium]|nr:Gfo/Idh/MocA family oxidoreductase [Planctomycetaceae bacterium]
MNEPITRRRFVRQGTLLAAGAATAAAAAGDKPAAAGPPKPRIKIGQIGIGHNHASAKMATFRKLADHYEVVGVVEPDPEWRKKRGNDPAYRDLTWMTEEQLLNTKGLTAVAVEVDPGDEHLMDVTGRCIDAGMHVHLDKPGGESFSAFKKVLDEAGRKQLAVQLGYMYRNNPAVQFCFRAVREGWLGQVFEVHAVMSRDQPLAYRQWLSQFHGGTMFIFGCHLIDLVIAMLGKPDRITPYQRQTRPEVDLYDNGLAVFEYPRTTVTIRTASMEVKGYERRQLVVCGDQGTVDIRPLEPPKLRLALAKPRDPFQQGYQDVALPPMPGRYDDQLIELARIIRGEIENPYPLAHELAVQEALLAACGY